MDKTVNNVFENVTEAHRKAVDAFMGFNKIAVRTQEGVDQIGRAHV